MKKKLTLSIPKPCHEDWNKMQPSEQGRFCLSCQKDVVDLSAMTDKELYNFFSSLNGKTVCGNIDSTRLNSAIPVPVEPKKKKLWYVQYLTAVFLFFNKSEARAQVKAPTHTVPENNVLLRGKVAYRPVTAGLITVKVIDAKGNPISGVSVAAEAGRNGGQTNEEGNFSFKLNNNDSLISFSRIGYEERIISLAELRIDQTVKLSPSKLMLQEVVVVAYPSSVCRVYVGAVISDMYVTTSVTRKIIDTISGKNIIKAYPNPVARGASVNIKMKAVAKGEYQIQMINESGAIVESERFTVPEKQFNFNFTIDNRIAAGTYFLRVISPENKLVHKGKLVVL